MRLRAPVWQSYTLHSLCRRAFFRSSWVFQTYSLFLWERFVSRLARLLGPLRAPYIISPHHLNFPTGATRLPPITSTFRVCGCYVFRYGAIGLTQKPHHSCPGPLLLLSRILLRCFILLFRVSLLGCVPSSCVPRGVLHTPHAFCGSFFSVYPLCVSVFVPFFFLGVPSVLFLSIASRACFFGPSSCVCSFFRLVYSLSPHCLLILCPAVCVCITLVNDTRSFRGARNQINSAAGMQPSPFYRVYKFIFLFWWGEC